MFNSNDYIKYQKRTLDPFFKGAIVSSNDEILYLNRLNHENFTYNACNEIILTVPVVFYIHKNSYLTEIINEKIDDLKAAGLIDYWISKYLDPKYLRLKETNHGPTKLNFKELLGAFQLFAFGVACSTFAFAVEICSSMRKVIQAFLKSCKRKYPYID